jgi:hypothetical protein
LSPASLVRVLAAFAGAQAIANLLPAPAGLGTVMASLAVAGAYVGILILVRELDADDLRQARDVVRRRA